MSGKVREHPTRKMVAAGAQGSAMDYTPLDTCSECDDGY
jgi:hypothetical protein